MSPKPSLPLRSCRIRNFKAIRDSETVRFTPLTVFIGNNGSGKSSVVEALEAMKSVVLDGVDAAMERWHGFEHAWNKSVSHKVNKAKPFPGACSQPMSLFATGRVRADRFKAKIELTAQDEHCDQLVGRYVSAVAGAKFVSHPDFLMPDYSISEPYLTEMVSRWQFLSMVPDAMTEPKLKRRSGGRSVLAGTGTNVADYLQGIYDTEAGAFEDILDVMRQVLPFAEDIRPRVTPGIEKKVYLELAEHGFRDKLPSWLFSTGTIRILTLLAVLRNPQPPTVVFIEEIENGLDPRTIHLLVSEIASFIETGGQVVVTTHSPYLLDLLDLSQIVVVERSDSDAPTFTRPSKQKLKQWADKFAPGKLYTMGSLTED